MAARKAISKKVRFEVFKRDSFKCQYCGKSAPEVILEIDHIKPVSKGGTNDMTNLVAACSACNNGKRANLLDDNTVIEKQKAQLDELNKRREQLEMMLQWKEELLDLSKKECDYISEKWFEFTQGYDIDAAQEKELKQLIKKHGFNTVYESVIDATNQYLELNGYGIPYAYSVEDAWKYVGKICNVKTREIEKPYLKDLFYIRGILKNRLSYWDSQKALIYLEKAYLAGYSIDSLKDFACMVRSWTEFVKEIERVLQEDD